MLVIISASSRIISLRFRLLSFTTTTLKGPLCQRIFLSTHEPPRSLSRHSHLAPSPCSWSLFRTAIERERLSSKSSQFLEARKREGLVDYLLEWRSLLSFCAGTCVKNGLVWNQLIEMARSIFLDPWEILLLYFWLLIHPSLDFHVPPNINYQNIKEDS